MAAGRSWARQRLAQHSPAWKAFPHWSGRGGWHIWRLRARAHGVAEACAAEEARAATEAFAAEAARAVAEVHAAEEARVAAEMGVAEEVCVAEEVRTAERRVPRQKRVRQS